MDAGTILRRSRRRAGLTQRQLAEAAGTSAAAVCLYESGARVPRADTLIRLIAATGASLSLSASGPNPVDGVAANHSLQAALELAAALPYVPSREMQAPVFAELAR